MTIMKIKLIMSSNLLPGFMGGRKVIATASSMSERTPVTQGGALRPQLLGNDATEPVRVLAIAAKSEHPGAPKVYSPPHKRRDATASGATRAGKSGVKKRSKVWVVVRYTGASLAPRRRRPLPGKEIDTGGTFVTIYDRGSIGSITQIPRKFRRSGHYAPFRQMHVSGFHREGRADFAKNKRLQVPLSARATGPFEKEVFAHIHKGGTFLGPAYPYTNRDGRELISDTQLCVSGGVEEGEEPRATAIREVEEEIGFTPHNMIFGELRVDKYGNTHQLFYAEV